VQDYDQKICALRPHVAEEQVACSSSH